jgi:hypothetical protein
MKTRKAIDESMAFDDASLTVRLMDFTGEPAFASRSALEDFLSIAFKHGAALGWVAGQQQLTQVGVVYDDKEITRDADGHITGMRTRRKVALPGGSLTTIPGQGTR